ncbi:MAG: lipopolysaccharide biosynthesis protein [Planctomycetes bacterium]|nr:lipopolysaccharide biosynthesis protein [Planctomycetota bacterium]
MSTATVATELPAPRTDTLARSVVLLLILTVLQRGIGFARGLLFCRWLSAEQLGEWELSFSFLLAVSPIAILALPGVFGRYLEYFRFRGQLRMFLRRTAIATVAMVTFSSVMIALFHRQFSQLVFGRDDQTRMVWLLAVGLFILVLYNFTTDLFTAVRQQRLASRLQLVNTLAFSLVSAAALLCGGAQWGAGTVLVSYLIATVISLVVAVPDVLSIWREANESHAPVSQRSFWGRLAPFALSIWITSWLVNLFFMVDRYMIVHYSGLDADATLAAVGQYHTARLVPMLVLTFAFMLAGALLPFLSHEWEAHGRQAVSDRLNLMLKVLSAALLPASAVLLLISPALFNLLSPGKFDSGLDVLPMTMCFSVVASLACVARNWLWCDERAWLSNIAYLVGLVVCIALSLWWLPSHGLMGATAATLVGNLATLAMMLSFNRRRGMALGRGTQVLMVAPLVIAVGPWATLGVSLVLLVLAVRTQLLFSRDEKRQLLAGAETYLRKYKLWPARRAGTMS